MIFENIIVVPYRNRTKQFDFFLKNTIPLIEKHLPKTKVVVVEQNSGKLFNRGCLLNIGFTEYKDKTKYFLTHDIDINPTELFLEKYKLDVPPNTVMGLYTSVCNTLGGIIKISSKNIFKVNGFPNDIWGWGAEDSALQNRTKFYNIGKTTFLVSDKSNKSQYLRRFDNVNDREKKNHMTNLRKYHSGFGKKSREEQLKLIRNSGLNNIQYKISRREHIHPIVELIKVII
jgi:hypothetical protein